MNGLAARALVVYREAVAAMSADRLVATALAGRPVEGTVRVLAMGKAAGRMMAAALSSLEGRARDPLCLLAAGSLCPPGIPAIAGEHPRPGPGSAKAGEALLAWVDADRATPIFAFVSGGASALVCAPAPGIPFEAKADAIAQLMAAGVPIAKLNGVRKHLSAVKGGELARRVAPRPVTVFALSDVPGDDYSTIGSGPFSADPTTFAEAAATIAFAGLEGKLDPRVQQRIRDGVAGTIPETAKPGDPVFATVSHVLLAGPMALARAAGARAEAQGFAAEIVPTFLQGDVKEVAATIGGWARTTAARLAPGERRVLVAVGEPTVKVRPGGQGGRAQHLALLVAQELEGLPAAFLAAGSDGRDGPTDFAGALVEGTTAADVRARALDLSAAIAYTHSTPLVRALGAGIDRFDSGTNLCDLHLCALGAP